MRRAMLTLTAVCAMAVAFAFVAPQTANAARFVTYYPVGTPVYYPTGYTTYATYPYPGPAAAQSYVGAPVAVAPTYVYPRYGYYWRQNRPLYAPYGSYMTTYSYQY